MRPWIFDALVILGVTVMTLGLIGMYRMPDIYTKSHAASKSVFMGLMVIGVAAAVIDNPALNGRVVIVCLALLITTPVASHAIGRAAYLQHESMEHPGAIDESGSLIAHGESPDWRV